MNDCSDFLYPSYTGKKKWDYNVSVHWPFIVCNKTYDSVGRKYFTVFSLNLEYPGN
jgi:hypothetical protein